jgi:galactokinase
MHEGLKVLAIDVLERYALENYQEGGHWVYETHGKADYLEALEEAGFDLEKTKANLKDYWELMNEQQAECRWA